MAIPLLNLEPADFVAVSALDTRGDGFTLNSVYFNPLNGKWYKFVYNPDSGTISAGDCLAWFDTTPAFGHVQSASGTTGMDDGTAGCFAGVGVHTIATLKYGFVQVGGPTAVLTTDAGVAKGDKLVINGGTSPDKTADTMADGEEECVFAQALIDDTSTNLTLGLIYFRG